MIKISVISQNTPVPGCNPAHKRRSPRFLDVNRLIRPFRTKLTRVHIVTSGAFCRISLFLTAPIFRYFENAISASD